ncbi:MAG: hypothetical protein U0234_30970 [Sandaracinus sp.]
MATETPADRARHALLALHKSIIDATRDAIEKSEGVKPSPNQLLQRLVSAPELAWLGALTSLIVRLDEAMEPDATESPAAVVAYAVDLLTPGDEESTHAFKIGYARALQDSPHVVLAHRAAMLALRAIA